jgi:hypothetical protein
MRCPDKDHPIILTCPTRFRSLPLLDFAAHRAADQC